MIITNALNPQIQIKYLQKGQIISYYYLKVFCERKITSMFRKDNQLYRKIKHFNEILYLEINNRTIINNIYKLITANNRIMNKYKILTTNNIKFSF